DRSRNTPGTGLGLALVAAVARLHDSRLELHDGPGGRGLTVALDLSAAARRARARSGTLKTLS
ncbi:sensor histidine kinase, partial [Roseomonas sp. DSM 102946]|nr:sensor histidine kinase [Roseomonas sp. DSM 102946]